MQLLVARAKAELGADVRNGTHHREPIFARSMRAYDKAMHAIEQTEPEARFSVDDSDTWPGHADDDDDEDDDAYGFDAAAA